MAERLGVCVVGCGDMGTAHLSGWSQVEDTELVTCADVDLERANQFREQYGFAAAVQDYREAVARDDVDAVSVCTPAALHADITEFAADHGKHCLCEKPIGLTLEDAARIIQAADRNNVKIEIGFQRRHSDESHEIRRLIAEEVIGRPVLAYVTGAAEIRPKRAMHDLLHGNGGPIIDACCHYFDLWRLLFEAEPVRVYCDGFTFARGRPELAHIEQLAPDTGVVIVEHDSGDLGVLMQSWGLPPGLRVPGMDGIWGPRGVISPGKTISVTTEGGETREIQIQQEPIKTRQVKYFARCVREGLEPLCPPESGRIALAVSLAALESMDTGQPVEIA